MKRLQFKIKGIFAVMVEDDVTVDEIDIIQEAICEQMDHENTTAEVVFFENMEMVCANCGMSLNEPEEKEDMKCISCSGAEWNLNHCQECSKEILDNNLDDLEMKQRGESGAFICSECQGEEK